MTLLPHHQHLLDASAISPEVARARGYRSVTVRAELERLCFGRSQRSVPALLVLIWNVHQQNGTYQARPDAPRVKDGKALKYEMPSGSGMLLDVPPLARPWLSDPNRHLFITEGVKADAAVTIELCYIGLLGVYGWRGTGALGGKVALPDWEVVALNAAGHFVDDLLALATERLKPPPPAEGTHTLGPYGVKDGCICYRKREREGDVLVLLCNFAATITSEIRCDNGVEVERLLTIAGTLDTGKPLSPVTVRADEIASMSWVLGQWGARAVLSAGMGAKERLREAIQRLSGEIPERIPYAHTGWRRIDGVPVYLHGGGGISASGLVAGVEVVLSGKLQRV